MGTGHTKQKQLTFKNLQTQHNHGGILRKRRRGRRARPLSTRWPIHVVFKADRKNLKRGLRSPAGFSICLKVIQQYAHRFFIKIESQAICGDHIHLVIRLKRRSLAQHFFRVVAGQIAQKFENQNFVVTDTPKLGLAKKLRMWKLRPFTRVVLGWRAHRTVIAYVRLNEKEAQGVIPYRKERLRGLSTAEWELIWT